MNNERISIEIADNINGLVSLETAREKALYLNKMVRALYLEERAAITKKVTIEREKKEKELNANPAYQTLYSMHLEYKKLLKKATESWFGNRYRKQAEKIVEAAQDFATKEFKFVGNEMYVPWVTDIEDIISKVENIDYVKCPDVQDERIIEMRLVTTKDWEKKSFDELYKIICNG